MVHVKMMFVGKSGDRPEMSKQVLREEVLGRTKACGRVWLWLWLDATVMRLRHAVLRATGIGMCYFD